MMEEMPATREMMESVMVPPRKKRRMKLITISVVAMIVVGYLIYAGVRDTMVYYVTVSQLLEREAPPSEEGLRIGGKVHEGSVVWDPKTLSLRFIIEDEKGSLPVVYQGVVPDSFKQGKKVIVEGTFAGGVFKASQIMPTCPSKYE